MPAPHILLHVCPLSESSIAFGNASTPDPAISLPESSITLGNASNPDLTIPYLNRL